MKTIYRLALSVLLGAFLLVPAFAQINTLTQTTLSAAAGSNDTFISVASATGINAPSLQSNIIGSMLYVIDPGFGKGEAMRVRTVSGPRIGVSRGQGTRAVAHISGAIVLVGQPNWFYTVEPVGSCTAATTLVTPYVNIETGNQWLCSTVTNTWVAGYHNDIAFPSPTAAVASAAGLITPSGPLFHITGTAAITGFNIPVGFAFGQICAIPDGLWTTTNANNFAIASTAVVSKPVCWTYDANSTKFYPSY